MGKRSESLGVIISTQAANDMHPLSQMIDDAALVVDPSVYLQLASAPTDAVACNEALGKFLDLNEFRAQAEQAKRLPSFRAKFENLRPVVPSCHFSRPASADSLACLSSSSAPHRWKQRQGSRRIF